MPSSRAMHVRAMFREQPPRGANHSKQNATSVKASPYAASVTSGSTTLPYDSHAPSRKAFAA